MIIEDELIHAKGDKNDLLYFLAQNGQKLGGVLVIGQQNTPAVCPGDTAINTLFQMVIPGGLMGPNDSLRVNALFSFGAGSTNGKTIRCMVGGADMFSAQNVTSATALSLNKSRLMSNRNSVSSQVQYSGWGEFAANASAVLVQNVNFAVDQNLIISGQKAVAGDVIILESVQVELLRGV